MAKGDVKSWRGRGGGGYSGGYSYYDDEGRGASKTIWEQFRDGWTAVGFVCSWLFDLSDHDCYHIIANTVWRYNVCDGPKFWDRAGHYDFDLDTRMRQDDSRVARLVKEKCGEDTWLRFYHHLLDGYQRWNEHLKAEREEQQRKYEEQAKEWKEEEAQREAQRVKDLEEHNALLSKEVELVAGAIRAEFTQAFSFEDIYHQRQGDYLDDPVAGYATGDGFGEEIRQAGGIKLQITVGLDLSNSNYYNDVHIAAAEAFRDVCLSLEQLKEEHPNDLYSAYFIFAYGEEGKTAYRLGSESWGLPWNVSSRIRNTPKQVRLPVQLEAFRNAADRSLFNGEDTWIAPLFEQIQEWEEEHSDPGACRLDLVITDAVLEHPTDIRKASQIQEHRDGNLQTVFLNLLPEGDWEEQALPYRCVQYPVNKDNLGGLLRLVLQQFVSVYL